VADRLAEMSDEAAELIESVQVDLDGFNLPDQPDLPEAEVHPEHMEQNVLMDSRWPFHEQLLRLKASRAYTPWQDEGRVR